MTELLEVDDIRTYYSRLLRKPEGYIKILKNSITPIKFEQFCSYVKSIHINAIVRLDNTIDPETPYTSELSNEWPWLPDNDMNTEQKLKFYLASSEKIIEMFEDKKPGITLPELALIKHYNGEILKKDGSKLYGEWAKYHKKLTRIGTLKSDLTNKNKVELFIKVIEKLSGEAKKQAEKDLSELKNNIENQGFII